MEWVVTFGTLMLVFIILFRVLLWGLGFDQLAKSFPGTNRPLKGGCGAHLVANFGTSDGWVFLSKWKFCVQNETLYMNVSPEALFARWFPSLGIPVSELEETSSSDQLITGGWRRAYCVRGTKFIFRLPRCVAKSLVGGEVGVGPQNA